MLRSEMQNDQEWGAVILLLQKQDQINTIRLSPVLSARHNP